MRVITPTTMALIVFYVALISAGVVSGLDELAYIGSIALVCHISILAAFALGRGRR